MTDLHYHDLLAMSRRIGDRTLSSREATEAQLDRILALDGTLHAYALVMAQSALAEADAADREIAAGLSRGPLHGVPIAVKDLCWVKGFPTAAGMAIHKTFIPQEDATVVARLNAAGAVLLGKTELSEGAYADHHPTVTAPVNPWNAEHWSGISSSGSAVAVAAGLCYGALASDTGGSIRWPAAANGVTGIKPSWGRVSRHGVFELAASLDHVGVMARSAEDCAALLGVIAGSDAQDPTALPDPVPDYLAAARRPTAGLRIGIDPHWNGHDIDAETSAALAAALAAFRDMGARIIEVAMPDVTQIIADWTPNCAIEAAVAHRATYPALKEQYGAVLAAVIEQGRALSACDYQHILLRRMEFRGSVDALFAGIDLLLTPVQPMAPLSLATISTLGEQPELIAKLQRYTCPFDMTGHPTLTLPGGISAEGLPIGFQLVAGRLNEAALFTAGAAFQRATSWHRHHPIP